MKYQRTHNSHLIQLVAITSVVGVRQYPLRQQRVKPFPQDGMADAGIKSGSVQCIHLSSDCWKNQLN